jgi:hypothetical protein
VAAFFSCPCDVRVVCLISVPRCLPWRTRRVTFAPTKHSVALAGNNHQFGLDGTVTGKHGTTQLGDLATVICSYDQTAGYTSNSLASYFHDLGWRQRLYDLVQTCLLGPSESTNSAPTGVETNTSTHTIAEHMTAKNATSVSQSLGGNYGESTPSDLGFDVSACSNATAADCMADKDPRLVTYDNTLSALSAAEMLRRIALHREVAPQLQFPNATWRDIQVRLVASWLCY